ncbi:probable sulfate transporter 3.5 isoform X2 [Diospyros lotus]|uniref:probable sulfate transporter 3.5 isoform X2 n=1 Tax=Diospyros lotus TaxID=55363 RepID=UPI00225A400C|nr:probable sulfate transporter 3.5 isoform X2 [Diospyros lotus]XP_052199012.1 probable sulfate transporter 3.5 isoform X2 [Diospyros lotus]
MASPAESADQKVSFAAPRSFATTFKAAVKETLFPDDPFHDFKNQTFSGKTKKAIQYFVPIFQWLPNYNLRLFRYDLLAGITIASLAIPQGISYAKLANVPPVIGLYSSFVPPLVYAVFGSSKHVAVGTVAACSLLISSTIGDKVSPNDNPDLYLRLVFTATFFAGLLQTAMGFLRLGILVDFLSHSAITGFMGGTAMLICLQQLKGMFGLKHFTTKTDVVSVLRSIFSHRNEWRGESVVVGIIFLVFLQVTRYFSKKKPKLFWVSAIAPMVVVVTGGLFAYLAHAEKHGIEIVGDLKKGLNPLSIKDLNFDAKYISAPLQAGIITAMVALAEGIAIGRSFAIMKNEQIDGNKEMIAFGLMNIVGSLTSCYLTTGPFSKTAVNFNAGCKTAMSNVVMSLCMMLTLLLLAHLFRYTPLVALSAIIMSAMFGLIKYKKAYHLFKTDKFDFCICMVAFFGVSFISMDIGLMLSIGLSILRALLYVARPASCKLGKVPNSTLYRDVEQYPGATELPGTIVLQLGSPIYFANCTYIRERILRWVRDEEDNKNDIEHLLLDFGGVTSIDITGLETLVEVLKNMEAREIKVGLVNPRLQVMEKLIVTKFVEKIGKENVFLSIEDAVEACRFALKRSKQVDSLGVELCTL